MLFHWAGGEGKRSFSGKYWLSPNICSISFASANMDPKIKTTFLSFSCSQMWPWASILINGVLSRSGMANFQEMPYRERACLSFHPPFLLDGIQLAELEEPSWFQSWKQHVEEAEEQGQRSLSPDEHGASIYR